MLGVMQSLGGKVALITDSTGESRLGLTAEDERATGIFRAARIAPALVAISNRTRRLCFGGRRPVAGG